MRCAVGLLPAAAAALLLACGSADGSPSGGAGGEAASPGASGSAGVAGTAGSPSAASAGSSGAGASCSPEPAGCPASAGLTQPCGAGHCTGNDGARIVQATTYDTCHPDRLPDMGVTHPPNPLKGQFAPTLHGSEGDDDQCKYHVKLQVDSVAQDRDVSFTLDVTKLSDGSPVKDDAPEPSIEAFSSSSRMASTTDVKSTMIAPGKFTVGPVRFDECGRWTVRFHLFPHCGNDFADSPYGSIAFFLDVP